MPRSRAGVPLALAVLVALAVPGAVSGARASSPVQTSGLGSVAVEDLDYCDEQTLPPSDDGSSDAVAIPFPLRFFGTPYSELFVNTNGNITFGAAGAQSAFTPAALTQGGERPIIAPFFADVDTRGESSGVVTWGTSPDGNSVCVTWADVGYYEAHDDLLNTAQLILTEHATGPGRVVGDFDIRFNYDRVSWETGDASGGSHGLGGTSAAAGFSAGTGAPNTFDQLPGSFVNGALLDGHPQALVAGMRGSTQPGRYEFEVRNAGLQPAPGSVTGQVARDSDSSPVVDATVQVCHRASGACRDTRTDGTGSFTVSSVPAGDYDVVVWPPTGALFGGGTTVHVIGALTTTADQLRLSGATPMPPGTTLNGRNEAGVPAVSFDDSFVLQVTGCSGVAAPSYAVRMSTGETVRTGALAASGGVYTATVPLSYPHHGAATVTTNVPRACGGEDVGFDLYLDPAGVVTDQFGRPLSGAQVTLLHADAPAGPYTVVPSGSGLLSTRNRSNPTLTAADGRFVWDVVSGSYEVRAERAGCSPGTTAATPLPTARTDLLVTITCTATLAPARGPAVAGTPTVGTLLRVVPGLWPAPVRPVEWQWLRDGVVVGTGTSRRVVASDVGHRISVRETAGRPDYAQRDGSGVVVHFETGAATSAAVTGRKAASSTTARLVRATIRASAHGRVTVTVRSTTARTGRVRVQVDGRVRVSTTLRAAQAGRVTLTLPRLSRGRHHVRAVYAGSASVLGSTSRATTLTITR